MNPPYTYRNRYGIYYFRLVIRSGSNSASEEIRFSLRTRDPYHAKLRSMAAWLSVQRLFNSGNVDTKSLRQQLKHEIFSESVGIQSFTQFHPNHTLISQASGVPKNVGSCTSSTNVSTELIAYAKRKIHDEQWSSKTYMENTAIFETFVEIVGDKPVSEISKTDVERYVKVVSSIPPNRKKLAQYKNLSSSEAADLNRSRGGRTLSLRQRKKYFTTISPVFDEFVQEGLINFNYFHRYRGKARGYQQSKNARSPFTDSDLKVMLEGDVALRLLSRQLDRPSRVWGILIALFTGARAEEIFSLSLSSIRQRNNIHVICIDDSISRVKTDAALRSIPVHPRLIELGFLQYLSRAKAVQSGAAVPMLFPELSEDSQHGFRRAPTRWFNNSFLPKLGLKTNKKSFHSFRHSVADKMKRGRRKIDSGMASQYIGHEDKRGPLWEHLYGSPFTPTELLEVAAVIDYDIDFRMLKESCLNRINPKTN